MKNLQILDCTLRDGGYVNDFRFGENGIRKIISQLTSAGVDIVECGFLEDGEYDKDCSVYTHVEQIAPLLPSERKHTMYVAMACYGEYDLQQLCDFDGTSVGGIRVTFHYNEIEEALKYCKEIINKGYKVFVQPVGTTSYTDEQLVQLIERVNELQPYAFYLVDTLGLMLKDDVLRFYNLIDSHLNDTIHIGFHSHNNLQLSYSNSQLLAELETNRVISMDASVNGMGRGAGNLNTELIAYYLNTKGYDYEVEPLLDIVDEYISRIREQFGWGYDIPHYLAAINGCHPNYASFLMGKQTLTAKNIGTILRMIEPEKRSLFNKQLAEEKYIEFQNREVDDAQAIEVLREAIINRKVMILGPGKTITDYKDTIIKVIEDNNCIVIPINFTPTDIPYDYIFLSNLKRFDTTFKQNKLARLIHTSNIKISNQDSYVVNYSNLLIDDNLIKDNSAMMLLNLMTRLHPDKIFLAGLDGFGATQVNYHQENIALHQDVESIETKNKAMSGKFQQYGRKLNIEFVTPTKYVVKG